MLFNIEQGILAEETLAGEFMIICQIPQCFPLYDTVGIVCGLAKIIVNLHNQ